MFDCDTFHQRFIPSQIDSQVNKTNPPSTNLSAFGSLFSLFHYSSTRPHPSCVHILFKQGILKPLLFRDKALRSFSSFLQPSQLFPLTVISTLFKSPTVTQPVDHLKMLTWYCRPGVHDLSLSFLLQEDDII